MEEKENLFDIGETVKYEGELLKVIAEHERTIVAEFNRFPIPEKEEEFPFQRIVIRKGKAERVG
ncbi:hypothetical protein EPH95_02075 [Salicibibacter halophilus]|uniref:DUF2187 domain-containing protein n=1 Tax=Salicibibacter halophilus TaxID=2502791 RepID=A0A514LE41_9BACI|nr:hypothetical protein [Salicibibacter halophilus]QDI90109.1 hypothetical protein EPH95_02075 [Salicibibacter halophilus]